MPNASAGGAAVKGADVVELDAGALGDLAEGVTTQTKAGNSAHSILAELFWRHGTIHITEGRSLAGCAADSVVVRIEAGDDESFEICIGAHLAESEGE
jgi:hypothetical protein